MLKRSGRYLLLFIFIGGLLGSVLGEILQIVSPQGAVQSIFGEALSLGLDPTRDRESRLTQIHPGLSR